VSHPELNRGFRENSVLWDTVLIRYEFGNLGTPLIKANPVFSWTTNYLLIKSDLAEMN